ncbi:hypothetical protein [Streptomyces canus]|uniref:hypothetical protein n=1 Tax=Streptomyces canus TaxID=58343 RepID=UPI0027D7E758|nr:hypothetical protein [Streptomyces canus]
MIGSDWPSGATFPGSKTPVPVDTKAALNNTHQQNGHHKQCATVSTSTDVIGLDYAYHTTTSSHPVHTTSPSHAYDISPNVKDSAP